MLTITKISPGAGYRYLVEQVARGQHDFRPTEQGSAVAYFVDPTARGEAPGWWAGSGASNLTVGGVVTEEHMRLLVGEGRHPISGELLGQMWRTYTPMTDQVRTEAVRRATAKLPADATVEQRAKVWLDIMTMPERRPVAAYDVTVSPVKSVSLLWAFGDDRVKAQVMAAHHAAVRSTLNHLERHGAFTRTGANGLRQVDTAGLTAMVFDHRMSRDKDPQLHSHIVVSSKVQVADAKGRRRWLSLDGRALYRASVGARAAYERAVEVELERRLGVRFEARAGSGIREIVGINDRALAVYSKRRTAVQREMGERCRGPDGRTERVTDRRWWRRAQDATLRTRSPREGVESTREADRRWRTEDRAAGLDTAAAVRQIVTGTTRDETGGLAVRALGIARSDAQQRHARLDEAAVHTAVTRLGVTDDDLRGRVVDRAVRLDSLLAAERAVRTLARERAVWRREHLELAIGRVLQAHPRTAPAADWQRVQQLADRTIAHRIGGVRVLTPPALVAWGPGLVRVSDRESIYTRHRDLSLTTRSVLAAEKEVIAYAARRGAATVTQTDLDTVASELQLSADKTRALQFAVADDRRVVGIVGPAGSGKTYLQRAVADTARRHDIPVLGLTVGQHAAEILAHATGMAGAVGIRCENIAMWLHAQDVPPQGTTAADWQFSVGQWVIVDEASQASSFDLARLVRLLEPVGGKLILVGDPAQTSAVGPGGLFRYLAATDAVCELADVHRFVEAWEGSATLRLRSGDPTVLAEYDRRGRIVGGHRAELIDQMVDRWAADVLSGRQSMMLVETEAEVADLAGRARALLMRVGSVQPGHGVALADGNRASVGDLIVSRRNNRALTAGAKFVANRDQWRVLALGPDGEMEVENLRTGDTITLPAAYVAHHVHLAYAATVDSAQGRTVDIAHSLVDEDTVRSRLYVMLTRGQQLNVAYVVTHDEPREGHVAEPPNAAVAILADILRHDDTERSATETEQQLWADVDALHYWGPVFDDLTWQVQAERQLAVVRAVAGAAVADRLAGDPAMPALSSRLAALEEAGYDAQRVLAAVIRSRELDTAEDVAAVLAWRIDQVLDGVAADPRAATAPERARSYVERSPVVAGDVGEALLSVARICDNRIRGLAQLAADHRPAWTTPLGVVPVDDTGRRQWLARAGTVAAYRDRYRVEGRHPIGPEPDQRDAARWSSWHRARVALGVGTLAGRVADADEPQLRAYIDAQRAADAAAPPYVGDRLREAHIRSAEAQQKIHEIRLDLARLEADSSVSSARAAARAPRWWHVGGVRTRAVTEQARQRQRADAAAARATTLRRELETAVAHADVCRVDAALVEQQHQAWTRWYREALPVRYAGLAAAAERTRRIAAGVAELADAVRDTTAKVRAIPDTQPRPHARPVSGHLVQEAEAARNRARDIGLEIDGP